MCYFAGHKIINKLISSLTKYLFQSVQMLNVDGPLKNRLKLKMSLFLKFIEYMQDRSSIYLTSAVHPFLSSTSNFFYQSIYLFNFLFPLFYFLYISLEISILIFTFYIQKFCLSVCFQKTSYWLN